MTTRDSNRLSKRHLSSNTNVNRSTNLSVQPNVPALTPAQMYSNFEEWIKMCTDNVNSICSRNHVIESHSTFH